MSSRIIDPAQCLAIETKDVFFAYSTPVKVPFFKNLPVPIHRVIAQRHEALKGVSVQIPKGKVTALLGRNGSGKTTLIKILTGARLPERGSVHVFGHSPQKMRHRMGLCLGGSLIYHRLTGRENLEYFGRLYGVRKLRSRVNQLGEMLKLSSNLDQIVESYSFGMKVKLALARSMIHSPEILVLDEPTLGIDLDLATQIRKFVRELSCTVLLTTHYMEEADQLADNVCIIDRGKILVSGKRENILESYQVDSIPRVFQKILDKEKPVPSPEVSL